MKYDVHHAGSTIGGDPIGAFIETIEGATHRDVKELAEKRYAGTGTRVIVLPHRPPNEKLARALRQLERGRANVTKRNARRGGR